MEPPDVAMHVVSCLPRLSISTTGCLHSRTGGGHYRTVSGPSSGDAAASCSSRYIFIMSLICPASMVSSERISASISASIASMSSSVAPVARLAATAVRNRGSAGPKSFRSSLSFSSSSIGLPIKASCLPHDVSRPRCSPSHTLHNTCDTPAHNASSQLR